MRMRKNVAKIVAMERVSRVATAGRDGRPHVVPVCHVAAGDRLYFATGRPDGSYDYNCDGLATKDPTYDCADGLSGSACAACWESWPA